jgi:predicted RNA binding protein YcfA (HicA-like mRNA interferase family)
VKLPRDVGGEQLASALSRYGYAVTNRKGSHMRLTRQDDPKGSHSITIPAHRSLKVGTLSAILSEVAGRLGRSRDDLVRELRL